MPACKYGAEDVVSAVRSGALDEAYVDECAERILACIEACKKRASTEGFDQKAHHLLAQKCAEESIVLLQNNGVLPVKSGQKVAFIGDFVFTPRYQGAGSSVVNPTQLDTAYACMREYGWQIVGVERGFDRYGKKKKGLAKRSMKAAAQSDLVLLFLGLDEVSEAEGLDREHIRLPENQLEMYRSLRATGKRVAIVLSCGFDRDLSHPLSHSFGDPDRHRQPRRGADRRADAYQSGQGAAVDPALGGSAGGLRHAHLYSAVQ